MKDPSLSCFSCILFPLSLCVCASAHTCYCFKYDDHFLNFKWWCGFICCISFRAEPFLSSIKHVFNGCGVSMCSIPGRTESFWKEFDYVKNLWKHRQELKVEDAGVAALFGLECYAWFCAGEIIGRGCTFTGYFP